MTLGASGTTITMEVGEDGTYRLDGELFASGGTVRAENGNLYTLSLEEGAWKAGFNAPAVNVTLGASGTTITMEVGEDGTYRLDGELFASGGTVRAENGNLYTLSLEEGEWMPAFNAPAVNVTLGASGTTITMEVGEDGTYRLDGEHFASGGTVRAENGNLYTLRLEEGEWMPAFNAPAVNVTLGASGTTITMEVGEDGTYRLDGEHFASGGTVRPRTATCTR